MMVARVSAQSVLRFVMLSLLIVLVIVFIWWKTRSSLLTSVCMLSIALTVLLTRIQQGGRGYTDSTEVETDLD